MVPLFSLSLRIFNAINIAKSANDSHRPTVWWAPCACVSPPVAHSPQWWARPSRAPAPGRGPGAPAAAPRWSGPSPRSWPARPALPGGSREPLTNRRLVIRSQMRGRACCEGRCYLDFPAVVTQLTEKSEILLVYIYFFWYFQLGTFYMTVAGLEIFVIPRCKKTY